MPIRNTRTWGQGWQVFAGRWKKPFSAVKTGLAKIVFGGKNLF